MLLTFTNYLILIFTLGLGMLWVKVRTTALMAKSTEVTIYEGINSVMAVGGANDGATADEVVGAFDIDLSIG